MEDTNCDRFIILKERKLPQFFTICTKSCVCLECHVYQAMWLIRYIIKDLLLPEVKILLNECFWNRILEKWHATPTTPLIIFSTRVPCLWMMIISVNQIFKPGIHTRGIRNHSVRSSYQYVLNVDDDNKSEHYLRLLLPKHATCVVIALIIIHIPLSHRILLCIILCLGIGGPAGSSKGINRNRIYNNPLNYTYADPCGAFGWQKSNYGHMPVSHHSQPQHRDWGCGEGLNIYWQ